MKKSPKVSETVVASRIVWLGAVNKNGEPKMQIDIMREQLDTKSYLILPEIAQELEAIKYRKQYQNNFILTIEDGMVVGFHLDLKADYKNRTERKTSSNSIDIEVTDAGQKRVLATPPDFDESVVDTIKRKLPKDIAAVEALSIGDEVANHEIEEISFRKGARVFRFKAIV